MIITHSMKASIALSVAISAILAGSPKALGAIYKWIDANGNTHYSDKAPVGAESTTIKQATPPPAKRQQPQGRDASTMRRQAEMRRIEKDIVNSRIKVHKIQAENYDKAKCAEVKRQAEWLKKQDPLAYSYDPDYQLLGQKISLYCYP